MCRQAVLKTDLLTFIIVIKSNRTLSNAYFKIRQPKPKFLSAIDDENKNFFSALPFREGENSVATYISYSSALGLKVTFGASSEKYSLSSFLF